MYLYMDAVGFWDQELPFSSGGECSKLLPDSHDVVS